MEQETLPKPVLEQLVQLLRDTGSAHHHAFASTNGDDPEWPLWYAEYMYERLGPDMKSRLTKSELVHLLLLAEKERQAQAPNSYWPAFYADLLASHLGL